MIWIARVLVLAGATSLGLGQASDSKNPAWIWANSRPGPREVAFFRQQFPVEIRPERAHLMGSGDNFMDVYLNGQLVASADNWMQPIKLEVTRWLREGDNLLAVEASNAQGPAAVLLALEWEVKSGERRQILTDGTWLTTTKRPGSTSWTTSSFDTSSWSAAHEFGGLGTSPWSRIQWRQLRRARPPRSVDPSAIRLQLPPGFRAELVYSVPRSQGSWVCITFDPRGRLIASDQWGGLYRLTLPTREAPTQVVRIAPDIGHAQGLLYAFDALYVVGRGPSVKAGTGLFRLRDTNGDDAFDEVQLLKTISAGSGGEHGVHAVALGPEGESLYVLAGNHIPLIGFSRKRVPPVWGEDHLLPRMLDPSGHAATQMAPGGWLARTDPDGQEWELLAVGFRNAYDFALDAHGEVLTFDADMEYDIGLPWYRPTRVCHVTSGAEFGWRTGTSKWPDYFPDSLPAVIDIGLSSPTGVCFGYGARFPERYQHACFIQDWAYGVVYAVHLEPHGASYRATFEKFASGTPFAVTDLVIGPEGVMYLTVGGRRTKSAVYRILYEGLEATDPSPVPALSGEVAELHELRQRMERLHSNKGMEAVDAAWSQLDHADRFLRYAARMAVEHQSVELWQERALEERRPQAALSALLALVRHGDASLGSRILVALEGIDLDALPEPQQLELLRVMALCFIRMGPPDESTRERVRGRLAPRYPAASDALNRELSRLLVYLDTPEVVPRTIALLQAAPTQEQQIHYAMVLRNQSKGWTTKLWRAYFEWMNQATKYRGGASFAAYLRSIRAESLANMSDADRRSLAAVTGESRDNPGELEEIPEAVGPGQEWTVRDLLPFVRSRLRKRDYENGRKMYAAALCASCHRFDGEGGNIGQDLTGVASRFGVQDLLEDIINPSRVISEQYRSHVLTLRDGSKVEGRIVANEGGVLQVMTDVLEPQLRTAVKRRDVVEQEPSTESEMPPGLLGALNREEIADLIAYLMSRGDRAHRYFR